MIGCKFNNEIFKSKCERCNKTYSRDLHFNFCPTCGGELIEDTGKSRVPELNEKYRDTYGTWLVSTEGDIEGKYMKIIGIFEGHIDDIAFSLEKRSLYSLEFRRLNVCKIEEFIEEETINNSVNIKFDKESNMKRFSIEDRVETMKDIFKDRKVEVEVGSAIHSVKLYKK